MSCNIILLFGINVSFTYPDTSRGVGFSKSVDSTHGVFTRVVSGAVDDINGDISKVVVGLEARA
jgi:hypothetical protein